MPTPDLAPVFARLRLALDRHRDRFGVAQDSAAGFTLEMPELAGRPEGYVAGLRLGKRYVSH
ncbi:MAG: hypothetical protein ACJ761_05720 [Chloroflexota bacterium]